MTTLPKTVPVLKAEMICKRHMNGPNGTHCLLGWLHSITSVWSGARDVLEDKMRELDPCRGFGIIGFNDHWPAPTVASFWNEFWTKQGYTRAPSGDHFILEEARQ